MNITLVYFPNCDGATNAKGEEFSKEVLVTSENPLSKVFADFCVRLIAPYSQEEGHLLGPYNDSSENLREGGFYNICSNNVPQTIAAMS